MKRIKPKNRVQGIYKHNADGTRWKVRYYENGAVKNEYQKTEDGAKARAAEIAQRLGQENYKPEISNRSGEESDGGLTRGEWLAAIWAQMQEVREVSDPVLKIQGLDAIARAFKVIREDLAALEMGVSKPEDPSAMTDEDLEKTITKLRLVSNGTA